MTAVARIRVALTLFLPVFHTHPISPHSVARTGSDKITEAHQRELNRILQISFNPLSASMITDMDKVLPLLRLSARLLSATLASAGVRNSFMAYQRQ
jgi:hypothetical protein